MMQAAVIHRAHDARRAAGCPGRRLRLRRRAFLKLDLGVGESRQQAGALAIPFYDGRNVVGVKVRAIGARRGRLRAGQAVRRQAGSSYNLNCLNDA